MMLLIYIVSCILLGLTFHFLSIAPLTKRMLTQLRGAFAVVGDKAMSDEQKERALRSQSVEVLGTTFRLTIALIVVFAAAYLPIWLGEISGEITFEGFIYYTIQPLVIIGTIIACFAYAYGLKLYRKAR